MRIRGIGGHNRYIAREPYNDSIYMYRDGVVSRMDWLSEADCPAGSVLVETGRRIVPGINPGVGRAYVFVYDKKTNLKGFIDPRSPLFIDVHKQTITIPTSDKRSKRPTAAAAAPAPATAKKTKPAAAAAESSSFDIRLRTARDDFLRRATASFESRVKEIRDLVVARVTTDFDSRVKGVKDYIAFKEGEYMNARVKAAEQAALVKLTEEFNARLKATEELAVRRAALEMEARLRMVEEAALRKDARDVESRILNAETAIQLRVTEEIDVGSSDIAKEAVKQAAYAFDASMSTIDEDVANIKKDEFQKMLATMIEDADVSLTTTMDTYIKPSA